MTFFIQFLLVIFYSVSAAIGCLSCYLLSSTTHFFETCDVISNCLFNIEVKYRISASYKRKGKKTKGASLGLGDSLKQEMEVENMGIYTRNHWTSSLTNKPGKNGLKSQADGHYLIQKLGRHWESQKRELVDTSEDESGTDVQDE